MRITLNTPELELQANKVDTPTGAAWCVIMPDERKLLIKFHHGKWETEDVVSDEFVQAIGTEINRMLVERQPEKPNNSYSELNPGPKRARILKYMPI